MGATEPVRYSAAVRAGLGELSFADTGIALWVARPGEQAAVARALVAAEPERVRQGLPELIAAMEQGVVPRKVVVAGLPAEGGGELRRLNDRRDWTRRQGISVLLVLEEAEAVRFQREAPDSWSALSIDRRIPFEPDLDTDPELAAAALLGWTRRVWGRLDLRGLVRAEGEDVAWEVGEVYQDLRVVVREAGRSAGVFWDLDVNSLAESAGVSFSDGPDVPGLSRPLVVRGAPGTGKSFLLKWLACGPRTDSTAAVGLQRPFYVLAPLTGLPLGAGPDPLRHALREWLLEARQPLAHLWDTALAAGQVTVLLDGLDELPGLEARRAAAEAVAELHRGAPGCPVLVTSRIVGYDEAPVPGADLADLQPFAPEEIRAFLARWCARYARDRLGPGGEEEGRAEGEQLAADVLQNPQLLRLAANPLMLTILAIVHRTGLRLPDHRVELYGHVTRVLVERWNRVRSLRPAPSGAAGARRLSPMVRVADAMRLFGPLALGLVRQGGRAAVPEDRLHVALSTVMAAGAFREWGSPAEVLRLFQRELGLLVEAGPGAWSFLHLTLAEFFAALELVRSDGLERLVEDPTEVYQPRWREVLLLAAGELAVVRAEDPRADRFVRSLVGAAKRRVGRPSGVVPSVLGGLLADDPQLSPATAALLVQTLVPEWWFNRAYGHEAVRAVFAEAATLIPGQIAAGPHGSALRDALRAEYATPRSPKIARLLTSLVRQQPSVVESLFRALASAGVDPGPLVERGLGHEDVEPVVRNARWLSGGWEREGGTVHLWLQASAWLDARVRAGALSLELRVWVPQRAPKVGRRLVLLDWAALAPRPAETEPFVRLEGELPVDPARLPADAGLLKASVRRR